MALTQVSSGMLGNTGVTAGTYGGANTTPVVTVNAEGQVTTASNVPFSGITSTQLASTGVSSGTYGGSSAIPVLTVNAQGQVTSAANVSVSSTAVYANSGQLTANAATGTVALGLATTAVTAGSYGGATHSSITVDAYGRITAASNVANASMCCVCATSCVMSPVINATTCYVFSDGSVQTSAAAGVPTGTIVSFSSNTATPPTGFVCTGTIYNQSSYPTLYSQIGTILNPVVNVVGLTSSCYSTNVVATSQTTCSPWGLYGWGCLTTSSVTDCNACNCLGYLNCCYFTVVNPLPTYSSRSPGCGSIVYFSCTNIYTQIVQATCIANPNEIHCCNQAYTGCWYTFAGSTTGSPTTLSQYYGFRNNCTGGCGCWYLCCVSPCYNVYLVSCCASNAGCGCMICGCVVGTYSTFKRNNNGFVCSTPQLGGNFLYAKLPYASTDCKCRAILASGLSWCGVDTYFSCTNAVFKYDYTVNGGVTWCTNTTSMPVTNFPGCACTNVSQSLYTCGGSNYVAPWVPLHNYNPKSCNFFVIPTGTVNYGGCGFATYSTACGVTPYFEQILTTNNFTSWTCTRAQFAICCLSVASPGSGILCAYGCSCYNDPYIYWCCLNQAFYEMFDSEVIFDTASNCNYLLMRSGYCGGPSSFFSFEPSTGCFIKYMMPCAYQFMSIFNGCALWLTGFSCVVNGGFTSPPCTCICSIGSVPIYPVCIWTVPLTCPQNAFMQCCRPSDSVVQLLCGEAVTIAKNISGTSYGGYGGLTSDGIVFSGSMCNYAGNSCFQILTNCGFSQGAPVYWNATCGCVIGIDQSTWVSTWQCGQPLERYNPSIVDCVQCLCQVGMAIVPLASYNTSTQFQTPTVTQGPSISGCSHYYIKT